MVAWIVNSLIIVSLLLLVYKQAKQQPLYKYFWAGVLFKIAAGVGVGLLYKYYYRQDGDTFYLFNLAAYLADMAYTSPSDFFDILLYNQFTAESNTFFFIWNQPRALFFVKILSVINLLTQNTYWITSVYLSIFSFFGVWKLANYIVKEFKVKAVVSAFAFLFFPSFVFWTSGVLKESFMAGAIGLIIIGTLHITRNNKKILVNSLVILASAYILWYLKYYYAAILFGVLIAYVASSKFKDQYKGVAPYLYFIIAMVIAFSVITLFHPNLVLNQFPQALYTNYVQTLTQTKIPDYLLDDFAPNWASILLNAPQSLLTGLFKPWLWSAEANFQLLAALENLVVLILTATAVAYWVYNKNRKFSIEAFSLIVYVGLLATLLAFASPNYGSLIRYKTGFIPFFIILICNHNPVFNYFAKSGSKIGRPA